TPFLSRIAIPDSCRSNFLPFYHHPPHAFLLLRSLSRRWKRSPKLPCPSRVGVRFWASLTLRKLANASGRIVFNIVLFMDWQFVSGCLPPRLSTTQLPSTTDSQCSVRWGLPPHCWCALSGARRSAMYALIDFAKSIAVKELWVYTGAADDIAVSFYKSLGFEVLGSAGNWAPGRTMDDSD